MAERTDENNLYYSNKNLRYLIFKIGYQSFKCVNFALQKFRRLFKQ